jgi:hypothetical protein
MGCSSVEAFHGFGGIYKVECAGSIYTVECGSGSVVGIATAYELDSSGIESQWGEIFRTCPDRP